MASLLPLSEFNHYSEYIANLQEGEAVSRYADCFLLLFEPLQHHGPQLRNAARAERKHQSPGSASAETCRAASSNERGTCSQYGAIISFVKQPFQVGIVLLVLLAIFGVLLTPDTTDDPAGVTVRLDKSRLLVRSLLVTPAISLPPLTPTSPVLFSRTQVATTIAKLDLICTRLC